MRTAVALVLATMGTARTAWAQERPRLVDVAPADPALAQWSVDWPDGQVDARVAFARHTAVDGVERLVWTYSVTDQLAVEATDSGWAIHHSGGATHDVARTVQGADKVDDTTRLLTHAFTDATYDSWLDPDGAWYPSRGTQLGADDDPFATRARAFAEQGGGDPTLRALQSMNRVMGLWLHLRQVVSPVAPWGQDLRFWQDGALAVGQTVGFVSRVGMEIAHDTVTREPDAPCLPDVTVVCAHLVATFAAEPMRVPPMLLRDDAGQLFGGPSYGDAARIQRRTLELWVQVPTLVPWRRLERVEEDQLVEIGKVGGPLERGLESTVVETTWRWTQGGG